MVIAPSVTARNGRGADQSIPVEGRKCTLSTNSDHSTIGVPEKTSASTAALDPASRSRGPGRFSAAPISGQARQIATQTMSPARPASPTAAETSLAGRGGAPKTGALETGVCVMPARL